MLIGGVIAICVLLLLLAFVAPRFSRYPQRGVDKGLGTGSRAGSKLPGKLGSWVSRTFNRSMKATDDSAEAGRDARSKLPV